MCAVLRQNDSLQAMEISVANQICIQNFIYNYCGYYDFLFLCVHHLNLLSVNFLNSTGCISQKSRK